jgi:hypothetical protein
MTECTQESDHRHSIYSLVCGLIYISYSATHTMEFCIGKMGSRNLFGGGGEGRGSVFSSQQLTHSLPPFTLQPKQPKFYTGQMHDTLVHHIPSRQIIHIEGNPGPFQVASITDSSSMMISDLCDGPTGIPRE